MFTLYCFPILGCNHINMAVWCFFFLSVVGSRELWLRKFQSLETPCKKVHSYVILQTIFYSQQFYFPKIWEVHFVKKCLHFTSKVKYRSHVSYKYVTLKISMKDRDVANN